MLFGSTKLAQGQSRSRGDGKVSCPVGIGCPRTSARSIAISIYTGLVYSGQIFINVDVAQVLAPSPPSRDSILFIPHVSRRTIYSYHFALLLYLGDYDFLLAVVYILNLYHDQDARMNNTGLLTL